MCQLRGTSPIRCKILWSLWCCGDNPYENNTTYRPVCQLRGCPETSGSVLRILWGKGTRTLIQQPFSHVFTRSLFFNSPVHVFSKPFCTSCGQQLTATVTASSPSPLYRDP